MSDCDVSPEDLLRAFAHKLGEDFLMACRIGYYVDAKPLIPDHLYDAAEKEYTSRLDVDETGPLSRPGSDLIDSYTPAQRALYVYLRFVLDQQDHNRPPERP